MLVLPFLLSCSDVVPIALPTPVTSADVVWMFPPEASAAAPFGRVSSYSDQLPATGRRIDLNWPIDGPQTAPAAPYPLVVFLTGATVENPRYHTFAQLLAAYGFVVAIPEGGDAFTVGPFVEPADVRAAIDFVRDATTDPSSPIAGMADASRVALVGHSYGGESALLAAADRCHPLFCTSPPARPAELGAVVAYGSDLRGLDGNDGFFPVNNDGIPVAIIRGTLDGVSDPRDSAATFDQIQSPPAALITVRGAIHFAFTNNDPLAQISPALHQPAIGQPMQGEAIARWTALFLRAFVAGDDAALNYISDAGPATEANIDVELLQ